MNTEKYRTVTIKIETHEKLLRRKTHPRQSFNDVIEELINNGKK